MPEHSSFNKFCPQKKLFQSLTGRKEIPNSSWLRTYTWRMGNTQLQPTVVIPKRGKGTEKHRWHLFTVQRYRLTKRQTYLQDCKTLPFSPQFTLYYCITKSLFTAVHFTQHHVRLPRKNSKTYLKAKQHSLKSNHGYYLVTKR